MEASLKRAVNVAAMKPGRPRTLRLSLAFTLRAAALALRSQFLHHKTCRIDARRPPKYWSAVILACVALSKLKRWLLPVNLSWPYWSASGRFTSTCV
jgi:hypothetical protein